MKKQYDKDGIVIYNEDNLNVLRNMPDESVNLIYCDILYNTGKNFDDYNDNLGTPYMAIEWYRPRFEEMKRVLTSNGSIFIHCNWRLDSYIRILMDEIFVFNSLGIESIGSIQKKEDFILILIHRWILFCTMLKILKILYIMKLQIFRKRLFHFLKMGL